MERTRLATLLDRAALFLIAFQIVVRLCVSSAGAPGGANLLIHAWAWLAALAWFAARALDGRWTPFLSGVELPLALFAAVALFSLTRASYLYSAIDGASAFVTYALLVPLCAHLFAGRRGALLGLLVAGLAALALHGVLQHFWVLPVMKQALVGNPLVTPEMMTRVETGEPWATFLYPNSFAGFIVLLLPVAAGVLIDTPHRPTRLICLVAIVLGAMALAFTGAKAAWVASAVGAVAFAALCTRRRDVIIGCAVAGVLVIALLGPRFMQTQSMKIRAAYWSAAWRMKSEAALGIGLNNFQEHYYRYRDERQFEVQKAHNDYLQIFIEMGIVGLLAYLAFLGMTVRAAAREVPEPAADALPAWLLPAGAATGLVVAVLWLDRFKEIDGWPILVLLVGGAWLTGVAMIKATPGFATRMGLLAGFLAGCVHSTADFDLYEYGTGATFFIVAGLLATGRPREQGAKSATIAALACAMLVLLAAAWAPAFLQGEQLRDDRKYADAVAANPHDAENWAALADERAAKGDLAGADQAFAEAMARRPHHSPYAFRRAAMFDRLERYTDALPHYERALALFPTRAANHYALARVLDRLGRVDHALEHYGRALELERTGDNEHVWLTPPQRLRALARIGDHVRLLSVLKQLTPEDLDQVRTRMGPDYDSLTRHVIDRAVAEAKSR